MEETDRDPIETGEGNTDKDSSPATSSKQGIQRKYWAFTMFNHLEIEITLKAWLHNNCIKWVIGIETCPTTSRTHLQGFFELKKKMRLTQIQNKPIKWSKLEPCRSNEEDNTKYCSKEGNLWDIFPKPRAEIKIIETLRPWQKSLEDKLLLEPNDREIIWIYDEEGKKGKSSFCKYLIKNYDALYLTEGKKSDILNIVYNYVVNKDLNIVLLDVPRSNHNISYKSLEEIKNGIICNTKYETGTHLINPPHIVVFANILPDYSMFSDDRWCVYNINNDLQLVTELTINTPPR